MVWESRFARAKGETLECHCSVKDSGNAENIFGDYVDKESHSFGIFEGTKGADVSNLQYPPLLGKVLEIPSYEARGLGKVLQREDPMLQLPDTEPQRLQMSKYSEVRGL